MFGERDEWTIARQVYKDASWIHHQCGVASDALTGEAAVACYESARMLERRYTETLPSLAGDAERLAARSFARIRALAVEPEAKLRKAIEEAIAASDNDGGSASDAIQDMLLILRCALG